MRVYPLKYLKNIRCFRLISILVALLTSSMFSSTQAEESQAVVFIYHHFDVNKYPSTNIRLVEFDAHLDYLAQAGYQTWPLAKVVGYVRGQKPFADRGRPVTVFVVSDGVDQHF